MEFLHKDDKKTWYMPSSNVIPVIINPLTGLPPSNEAHNSKIMYFIKGTEPKNSEDFQSIFIEFE